MRIRTTMPSLSGATKILNRSNMNEGNATATLIYFWSMSCPQCEQSIRNLKQLGDVFNDRLTIEAIHMPREELDYSSDLVREKIKQLEITYPIHLDNELQISDKFGNKFVPAYYLFDQQQQLRFYKAGYLSTKLLQQKIERII
ncbi:TlpA family protein disulfide reductase [Solibacillus silvestris]|uniref:TlpA family protein disulfide reductase n=1 Tax=Solibacillus silvestris TaxID=76853 RepID=UPI003F8050CA